MELVRPWLDEALLAKAEKVRQDPARYNYKDALQEWTQGKYKILPEYRVKENTQAASTQSRFIAEVWLRDRCLGQGVGRSKKVAEQAAAKEAFFKVEK